MYASQVHKGIVPTALIADTPSTGVSHPTPHASRRVSISGTFGRKEARAGEPRYGFGDELHASMIEHAISPARSAFRSLW